MTTTNTTVDARPVEPQRASASMNPVSKIGDRLFSGAAFSMAWLLAVVVILILVFFLTSSTPSLRANQANFFFTRSWSSSDPLAFGIAHLMWVTLFTSCIALIIAVPIALGIALFVTQLAPKKVGDPIAFVVDLLAAVPSIIFGLWGFIVLGPSPIAEGIEGVLQTLLGWIPLFAKEPGWPTPVGTIFLAGIILAVMILPIITAVCRDVMKQTPSEQIEGALALGATRWEMIRIAVLPHSRSGIISGSMLGLGRALGETLAVTLVLQSISQSDLQDKFVASMFYGGQTFASKIGIDFPEATNDPLASGALLAAGLTLFVLTFVVNGIARTVAARGVKK